MYNTQARVQRLGIPKISRLLFVLCEKRATYHTPASVRKQYLLYPYCGIQCIGWFMVQ
jgi:hypothetical protein